MTSLGKKHILCGLLACGLLVLTLYSWFNPRMPLSQMSIYYRFMGGLDWHIFIAAAQHFVEQGILYIRDDAAYAPASAHYKFPPLFASALIYFMQQGMTEADLWMMTGLVHLILFFSTAFILFWLLNTEIKTERRFYFFCASVVLLIFFSPFIENFVRLQLEIYIVFLLALCLLCLLKQYFFLAGLCIGLATALKLYPIFFILYFIAILNYRALFAVLVGFLLPLCFTLPMIGLEEHRFYFTEVVPIIFQEPIATRLENVSLAGTMIHLGLPEGLSVFIGQCVLLASIAFFFYSHFKSTQKQAASHSYSLNNQRQLISSFSLLIATFVLCTTNSWFNYQLLLLISAMAILAMALSNRHFDLACIAMVLGAAILFLAARQKLPLLESWHEFFVKNRDAVYFNIRVSIFKSVAGLLIFLAALRTQYRVCIKTESK